MRRTAGMLAGIVLLAGCGDDRIATETMPDLRPQAVRSGEDQDPAVSRDIAALRTATAQFHRIEVAGGAGYDNQFPPGCFASAAGGMGFHFLKSKNVGRLNVTEPQLLLYEPEGNGAMRLVGVEYIVPGAPTDPAPQLYGRSLVYNTTFSVWALHVWAWKDNPKGIFADWNPDVTCANAAVLSSISHH
jgi:hypothetical protein